MLHNSVSFRMVESVLNWDSFMSATSIAAAIVEVRLLKSQYCPTSLLSIYSDMDAIHSSRVDRRESYICTQRSFRSFSDLQIVFKLNSYKFPHIQANLFIQWLDHIKSTVTIGKPLWPKFFMINLSIRVTLYTHYMRHKWLYDQTPVNNSLNIDTICVIFDYWQSHFNKSPTVELPPKLSVRDFFKHQSIYLRDLEHPTFTNGPGES